MSSYLKRLAQVFAKEVGDQLIEYSFVFPNHRAGLFFKRYLSLSLSRPVFSPQVMTINECFASLSDLHIEDPLSLLVRLYAHYKELRPDGESIERFLYWGKMMLADYSEVDNHLVSDVRSLFSAVEDMRDIDAHFLTLTEVQLNAIKRFWGEYHDSLHKKENTQHHQTFIRTWQLLYPLYQKLTESLLADGLAYEGLLHRDVMAHWDSIPKDRIRKHYVFVGFNALTESERQLLLHLRDMGRADFYFDYENSCLSDPDNRASLFMADNLRMFPSLYTIPASPEVHSPIITHVSVSSTVAETREVYHILQQLYPDGDTIYDYTRTAVVLPDEHLLLPLLDCFPESVKKINVTMGYPLRATALYKPIAYPEQHFSSLPTDGLQMIQVLREEICRLKNKENAEVAYQIDKVIDQVENVMQRYPFIDFSAEAVMQIMRMLTMDTSIPYVGEPLDGLQVMGVLETRTLDFDQLIITGFNDELYPGRTHNASFIPYTLRRGFGLPTPERQDAIFAYNFYRMLSYAQHVWLISNTTADDTHSGEISRYLYQLQWQYGHPIIFEHVVSPLSTPRAKEISVDKADVVDKMEKLRNMTFSASSINKYLYCQKQFYYTYVLGIKESPSSDDITIDDKTLGTVLHEILQSLYDPYMDRVVQSEDIQCIMDSLELRWKTLIPEDIQGDLLAFNVIKTYVRNILSYDYQQAPFSLIGSESVVRASISIPSVGLLRFYGKIDRVDKQKNDLRIIDYKTGSVDCMYRDIEHVFHRTQNQDKALQTLLYSWMFRCSFPEKLEESFRLVPHIYPVRRMADVDHVETKIYSKNNPDFEYTIEVENEFLEHLSYLMQEIFDIDTPFVPTSETSRCNSCAFYPLCKG